MKKAAEVFWVIALSAAILAGLICALAWVKCEDNRALYDSAMRDAVFVDADEILPLVTLTQEEQLVRFSEDGQKALMLSWHCTPDLYRPGESFACEYGEIWAFTDQEILSWYNSGGKETDDYVLRLEQLIGLPERAGYTHVSAFWADLDELIRPAYQTDVTKQVDADDLDGSALAAYEEWFDDNIIWSYFDAAYPWTRLGYTYDWASGENEYGLTEFLILPDSEIEVAWTVTTAEFWRMLADGSMAQE